MAVDEITVMVSVGPPNGEPAVRVLRANTVTVSDVADVESYAIEALRLVDELAGEVRAEALKQVRALMDRAKKEAAMRAEGVRR